MSISYNWIPVLHRLSTSIPIFHSESKMLHSVTTAAGYSKDQRRATDTEEERTVETKQQQIKPHNISVTSPTNPVHRQDSKQGHKRQNRSLLTKVMKKSHPRQNCSLLTKVMHISYQRHLLLSKVMHNIKTSIILL